MKEKDSFSIKEASLAAERAYRRGFQHGVNAAHKWNINNDWAAKFRFSMAYDKPYEAPERYSDGEIHIGFGNLGTLEERFEMENRDMIYGT